MKKTINLLIAFMASVTIANAEVYNGTCGAALTWSLNTEDSTLVISGTGAMYDYDWNSPWSGYLEDIKYVTIEEGVTTIGKTAFRDHIHMQKCSLPSTLTSIGNEAFCFCFQLIDVEIPASCTYIDGYGAFNLVPNVVTQNESLLKESGARSINGYVEGYFVYADSSKKSLRACSSAASGEIILDDAIWRIEYMAFAECEDITYIHFGRHLKSIGEWALNGCIGLEGLQFGEELEELGSWAFGNCFGLKYVYFPNSLVSVGDFAIGNCPVLRTIHLGNSLTSIGSQFFDSCPDIDTIYATMPTPPALDNTDFAATDLPNVKCYVPYESLSLYQQAPIWKEMDLRVIDEPEQGTLPEDFSVNYLDKNEQIINTEVATLTLPVAPTISGFTFLKWVVIAGDLKDGINIQAVYEADTPTSAPAVYTNPSNPAQKLLRNGNVYILTDDSRTYTLTGQPVK